MKRRMIHLLGSNTNVVDLERENFVQLVDDDEEIDLTGVRNLRSREQ